MNHLFCNVGCRTRPAISEGTLGPRFGDVCSHWTGNCDIAAPSSGFVCARPLLSHGQRDCCEALPMWMRRLDKQKLIIIALWVTRAMLNHPAR